MPFIVVYDFRDGEERNLDDLAIGAFDLDAWCRQGLRRLHAANDAANAMAFCRHDFHIVQAVEGTQGCESFSYFQWLLPHFL